jgi:hypothetical protein
VHGCLGACVNTALVYINRLTRCQPQQLFHQHIHAIADLPRHNSYDTHHRPTKYLKDRRDFHNTYPGSRRAHTTTWTRLTKRARRLIIAGQGAYPSTTSHTRGSHHQPICKHRTSPTLLCLPQSLFLGPACWERGKPLKHRS